MSALQLRKSRPDGHIRRSLALSVMGVRRVWIRYQNHTANLLA
jgi:hypothetical protein